jgi:hypothetical protein
VTAAQGGNHGGGQRPRERAEPRFCHHVYL